MTMTPLIFAHNVVNKNDENIYLSNWHWSAKNCKTEKKQDLFEFEITTKRLGKLTLIWQLLMKFT